MHAIITYRLGHIFKNFLYGIIEKLSRLQDFRVDSVSNFFCNILVVHGTHFFEFALQVLQQAFPRILEIDQSPQELYDPEFRNRRAEVCRCDIFEVMRFINNNFLEGR